MVRYLLFLTSVLFFALPIFATAASDQVIVHLLVDNGTSTSTTTESTSTSTDSTVSNASGAAGNGQPRGLLSPNGNNEPLAPIFVGSVVVTPDKNDPAAALFQWQTTIPTSATFEWGSTLFYGAGNMIIPINMAQNKDFDAYRYEYVIRGLSPGNHYFYHLTVRDESGRIAGYQGVYEVPISLPEHLPQNIFGLTLDTLPQTDSLIKNMLQWTNPTTEDFSEVRVVRSPFGFPEDPLDGKVVYEGGGESATDIFDTSGVAKYFYTVFVKGKNGTYSSGAVARYRRSSGARADESTDPIIFTEKKSKFTDTAPEIARLTPGDFFVMLYDSEAPNNPLKKVPLLDEGHISVSAGEKITISAAFEKFPQILKTIVVYITPSNLSTATLSQAAGPQKNMHSFLLGVNAPSTAYEATFLAPDDAEYYDVEVKIIDYNRDILRNISIKNALKVKKTEMNFQNILKNAKSQFKKAENPLLLGIFIALILLTLALRKIVRFF